MKKLKKLMMLLLLAFVSTSSSSIAQPVDDAESSVVARIFSAISEETDESIPAGPLTVDHIVETLRQIVGERDNSLDLVMKFQSALRCVSFEMSRVFEDVKDSASGSTHGWATMIEQAFYQETRKLNPHNERWEPEALEEWSADGMDKALSQSKEFFKNFLQRVRHLERFENDWIQFFAGFGSRTIELSDGELKISVQRRQVPWFNGRFARSIKRTVAVTAATAAVAYPAMILFPAAPIVPLASASLGFMGGVLSSTPFWSAFSVGAGVLFSYAVAEHHFPKEVKEFRDDATAVLQSSPAYIYLQNTSVSAFNSFQNSSAYSYLQDMLFSNATIRN